MAFIRSSELLISIPVSKREHSAPLSSFSTSTPARSHSPRPSLSFANPSPAPALHHKDPSTAQEHPELEPSRPQEYEEETRDADLLATARACFQAREFSRAVHLLRNCKSSKAQFLSLYNQFIVNFLRALYITQLKVSSQGQ
jgi:anaphase-promoting complex subunit 8